MASRSLAEFFADVIGRELCLSVPATASAIETRSYDDATWDSLVASPSAAEQPLQTQGDVSRVKTLPHGYFLAGFWGHGVNSYAFYWCQIEPGRRLYLRIPYGGVYSDTDAQRENLIHVLDACRRVLEAIERVGCERFYLTDSMDQGECDLVLSSGERIRLRGAGFTWDGLLEALKPPGKDEDGSPGMNSELRDLALEAAVLEDPGDPAPYLVYADWLQDRGHVRGELIALALQPLDDTGPAAPTGQDSVESAAEAQQRARADRVTGQIDRLIASNRRALLGKLANYSDLRVTWYMGFILGAQLRLTGDLGVVPMVLELPAARCVRELVIESGECTRAAIATTLQHAPRPSLLHTVVIDGVELGPDDLAEIEDGDTHDAVTGLLPGLGRFELPVIHSRSPSWPVLRHPPSSTVESCSFSSDGSLLATMGEGGERVWIWHVATGRALRDIVLSREMRTSDNRLLGFTAGDRALVMGGTTTHRTLVVGVSSGAQWFRASGIRPVALSRDGTTLVGVQQTLDGPTLQVLDAARGQHIRDLEWIDDSSDVRGELAPDGSRFAAITDRDIRVWRTMRMRIPLVFVGPGDELRDLAFSPSGLMAIGCSFEQVYLIDLVTDQTLLMDPSSAVKDFRQVGFVSDDVAFAITERGTVWFCRPGDDRWHVGRAMVPAAGGVFAAGTDPGSSTSIRWVDMSPVDAMLAVLREDAAEVELHDLSEFVQTVAGLV